MVNAFYCMLKPCWTYASGLCSATIWPLIFSDEFCLVLSPSHPAGVTVISGSLGRDSSAVLFLDILWLVKAFLKMGSPGLDLALPLAGELREDGGRVCSLPRCLMGLLHLHPWRLVCQWEGAKGKREVPPLGHFQNGVPFLLTAQVPECCQRPYPAAEKVCTSSSHVPR